MTPRLAPLHVPSVKEYVNTHQPAVFNRVLGRLFSLEVPSVLEKSRKISLFFNMTFHNFGHVSLHQAYVLLTKTTVFAHPHCSLYSPPHIPAEACVVEEYNTAGATNLPDLPWLDTAR